MSSHPNPFDRDAGAAAAYDEWYDSPAGRSVLEVEGRCVRALMTGTPRPWVEVGTGTGRFGEFVGAELGLDPALPMLRLADARLPSVAIGSGESLPLRDASIGAILVVTVIEFVADPGQVLQEIVRALRADGRAVIGFIERESVWAAAYAEQGREPDSVFHSARFFGVDDLLELAAGTGLRLTATRSGLFAPPGEVQPDRIEVGAQPGAGFVALALEKAPGATGLQEEGQPRE